MSDDDWKSSSGIVINFNPRDYDNSEDVLKEDCEETVQLSPTSLDSFETVTETGNSVSQDELLYFDEYGCTPPRTKISRKQKERKQRSKELGEGTRTPKQIHAYRNFESFNSMYLSETLNSTEKFVNSSHSDDELSTSDMVRQNKRSMKLLRGSERDFKLDLSSASHEPSSQTPQVEFNVDRMCSMPLNTPHGYKVESCNHFRSLTSKPVNIRKFKHKNFGRNDFDCPQDRVDFYNTFSLLIRMGSVEKTADKTSRRQLSHEEDVWQNELKDLLWLELQAWHADRTPQEQDEYLCRERSKVGQLLKEIMEYRFERQRSYDNGSISSQFSDSGVGTDDASDNTNEDHKHTDMCEGCLSMFCSYCIETQNIAFREVDHLLRRLHEAEQLYSSSKDFGKRYPLYVSPEFVGRHKAMCIWYNMTRHHRLRLKIVGKMLCLNDQSLRSVNWPTFDNNTSTTDSCDDSFLDTHSISRSTSIEAVSRHPRPQKVHFNLHEDPDTSSPSDSNNSMSSSSSSAQLSDTCFYPYKDLHHCLFPNGPDKTYMAPYRRYMEHVLKTRGLKKIMKFFEHMHYTVLKQAMITLGKLEESKDSPKTEDSNVDPMLQPESFIDADKDNHDLDDDEVNDLKKYGYWSEDVQSMNLPSYCSVYLFLARVPVEMAHQYILMRLEQKPKNPSELSLCQLQREFKEGVSRGALLLQRYKKQVNAVIWKMDESTKQAYEVSLQELEKSVRTMLEVQIDYFRDSLQIYVTALAQKKNMLEEEWDWLKRVSPLIGGEGLVSHKVSRITVNLLKGIGQHLEKRMNTIMDNVENEKYREDDDASTKHKMLGVCRDFQQLFNEVRENTVKVITFTKSLKSDLGGVHSFARAVENIDKSKNSGSMQVTCGEMILEAILELKVEILRFREKITKSIDDAEKTCDVTDCDEIDESEKLALLTRCREVLHTGYKFGFEYHKTVTRLISGGHLREKVVRGMISFAQQWMRFVMERCERGRGLRPTWANHGLEYLTVVCEPDYTKYISDKEFECLKSSIDECISHVVGSAQPSPHPRSRGSSPSPNQRNKSYLPSRSVQDTTLTTPPVVATPQRSFSLQTPSAPYIPVNDDFADDRLTGSVESLNICMTKAERVYMAVENLEKSLDNKLRGQDLIGKVKDTGACEENCIRPRTVNFSWQRGIKIGQGRFGKVYTAVNNKTGELMALKEVQLQPNDRRSIRHVTEELRIFESIQHNHMVRFYGVEIHREEMLIFMEFCPQGTLESLVAGTENGLPEALIRCYTLQLLQAVSALHKCGIVHRDIKPANIFLTNEGNCLKLGDFGCAAKIKAHTTMFGELQGFIGTQAYMAPEMFMKTDSDGHGRASDVWSVGCCVVEMASGKRPWVEYDSNFQIMFKVGMGQTPAVPETLSKEGRHFLSQCFQHDPKERAFVVELMEHPFVRVDADDADLSSVFESLAKSVREA